MNPSPGNNPFEPPPVGSYGGARNAAPSPPAAAEAVASLVCGILAWSCFPLGIVAIWLGVRARRAARENPERVGGDNLALGGMIIGGGFLALWLLYLGMIGVMILVGMMKR